MLFCLAMGGKDSNYVHKTLREGMIFWDNSILLQESCDMMTLGSYVWEQKDA